MPSTVLAQLKKPPITRQQLRDYAAASGDHNPIHLDEDFAKQAGFPSVIVHGMISMAFLGDFIVTCFPEAKYRLVRMHARFRKVTFPGDELTCEGEIKAQKPAQKQEGTEVAGEFEVACRTRNQKGEVTTEGLAVLVARGV